MSDDIEKMIARRLWKVFQFHLPDTPNRVARAMLKEGLPTGEQLIMLRQLEGPHVGIVGCASSGGGGGGGWVWVDGVWVDGGGGGWKSNAPAGWSQTYLTLATAHHARNT